MDHPNSGHLLLVEFMLDLPKVPQPALAPVLARQQVRGRCHSSLAIVAEIAACSLCPLLMPPQGEHHMCMMCFKAICKYEYGVKKILTEDAILPQLAVSLQARAHCVFVHT